MIILTPYISYHSKYELAKKDHTRRNILDLEECYGYVFEDDGCYTICLKWSKTHNLHNKYMPKLYKLTFNTFNEAASILDKILVEEGYKLLNDEEYQKYKVLL